MIAKIQLSLDYTASGLLKYARYSLLYYNYPEGLTSLPIKFLEAVSDGVQNRFSRKESLSKYKLGTSANLSRIKKALEDKKLIDITRGLATFNDPVFRLWFKREGPPFID